MARIRTIKPEFWRDEDLSKVSPEAALLAIGLLNHSDDEGYFNANPKLIESDVFPLRELSSSTTALLQELAGIGYLQLFSGSDGKKYGCVVTFAKHQVINKPTPSKIKPLCTVPEDYRSPTVVLPVGKEQGTGNREQGMEQGTGNAATEVADPALPVAVKPKKQRKAVEEDPLFEQFWITYDYNIDRYKALKSWNSIKPDAELAAKICQAADRYVRSTPDRAYRRHPTTWLNNRSWENEIVDKRMTRIPEKTQHQLNQEAVTRSIFGHLYPPSGATNIIEGDVINATENPPPLLG